MASFWVIGMTFQQGAYETHQGKGGIWHIHGSYGSEKTQKIGGGDIPLMGRQPEDFLFEPFDSCPLREIKGGVSIRRFFTRGLFLDRRLYPSFFFAIFCALTHPAGVCLQIGVVLNISELLLMST